MGTDIHLEVERLGEDGVWHWIEHPDRPCDDDYCTDGLYNEKTPNAEMHGQPHYRCDGTGHYVEQFFDDRNYDVFAILADVRNGYGFAGCDTGDGFEPIAEPRGLPDDLGPEIRDALVRERRLSMADAWGDDWWDNPQRIDLGEHSFSWLTVAEILDYDWTRTTKKRGWVGAEQFEVFERDGRPTSWSGGVSGGSVEHVSNQEMRRRITDGSARRAATTAVLESRYYTCVEWEQPYTDSAARFLQVVQRDIVPLGDPDKVRLVFGFDS